MQEDERDYQKTAYIEDAEMYGIPEEAPEEEDQVEEEEEEEDDDSGEEEPSGAFRCGQSLSIKAFRH